MTKSSKAVQNWIDKYDKRQSLFQIKYIQFQLQTTKKNVLFLTKF